MKVVASMRPTDKAHANVLLRRILARLDGEEVQRDMWCPADADLFIQWGFKPTPALNTAISQKIPYVIVDLGYFDPTRTARYSVSINGFHGLSMPVAGVLDLPPRPHPVIRDWRERGEVIQIIGQLPGDAALRGQDNDAWMHRAAVEATQAFNVRAIKRPHPKMINPWETPSVALQDTFDDTYVAVTWTSTAAVQYVLAGVPTVALHAASPVSSVVASVMERFCSAERAAWAHTLAHREYALTDDEDCDAAVEYILRAYPAAKRAAAKGDLDHPRAR